MGKRLLTYAEELWHPLCVSGLEMRLCNYVNKSAHTLFISLSQFSALLKGNNKAVH